MLGLIEITPSNGARDARNADMDDSTLAGLFTAWCREDHDARDFWTNSANPTAGDWTQLADLDALTADLERAAARIETAIYVSRSCR